MNAKNGQPSPLVADDVYNIIMQVICPCASGQQSLLSCGWISIGVHPIAGSLFWGKTESFWLMILISSRLVQNADRLDSEIIYDRDFDYDYFGFKVTLFLTEQECAQARRLYETLDSH